MLKCSVRVRNLISLEYNSTFRFGTPQYLYIHLGLEVRGWGLLMVSHANRLIEMTTSHCCRVLCSHLHSSEQIQLTSQVLSSYFAIVGHRSKMQHFMP